MATHNAQETQGPKAQEAAQPCPQCHRVGYHGRIIGHGPPWNPWAQEDLGPCPLAKPTTPAEPTTDAPGP